MPVPRITLLQSLVLDAIGALQRPGKYIREKLAEHGSRKSLPAFYQMMARLEDAGLVQGENARVLVDEYPVTERRYKLTGKGIKAMEGFRDFYSKLELSKNQGKGVANG